MDLYISAAAATCDHGIERCTQDLVWEKKHLLDMAAINSYMLQVLDPCYDFLRLS